MGSMGGAADLRLSVPVIGGPGQALPRNALAAWRLCSFGRLFGAISVFNKDVVNDLQVKPNANQPRALTGFATPTRTHAHMTHARMHT
jgi:hypothetical protein